MSLTVRPLLPEEASVLRAIRLEALADNPPAFAERLDVALARGGEDFTAAIASGSVWGVFDQDQCVGMAGLDRFVGANVEHKAMIWGVFVSPAARGSGAARRLFETIIAHARVVGIEVLELGVGDFNHRAKRFYESFGFIAYGFELQAVKLGDRYIDEVLMALRL